MLARIVEIAEDKRHLSVYRGFLVVQSTEGDRAELGRIPLDSIAAVIAHAHGLSYTNNLLVALAQQGAPFVLCAANHHPVGMLLPIDGNFQQAKRFDAQIQASQPTIKRLWADVVKSKLQMQSEVLAKINVPTAPLSALIAKVKSGDPQNIEAQGARRYWGLLFGNDFRRDAQAQGVNSMLNYGYTILRATTARAVVAAGLHPTLGLHHSNAGNPLRLVDDLMEPFRPIIDYKVWQLVQNGCDEMTPETKKELVMTMYQDMQMTDGKTPVMVCTQKLATSLALIFIGDKNKLELPLHRVD